MLLPTLCLRRSGVTPVKKQAVVSRSTCEAEYISGRRSRQQPIWLPRLHDSMYVTSTERAIRFVIDSASAIEGEIHQYEITLHKHINIRHHDLLHHVHIAYTIIKHTSRKANKTELLTKAIVPPASTQHLLIFHRRSASKITVCTVTTVKGGIPGRVLM